MKVWLISFGFLFGLVELYQWFHALTLPLPVYGAIGIFLAIASNAESIFEQFESIEENNTQSSDFVNPIPIPNPEPQSQTQLPPSSISFKIHKPLWKREESQ